MTQHPSIIYLDASIQCIITKLGSWAFPQIFCPMFETFQVFPLYILYIHVQSFWDALFTHVSHCPMVLTMIENYFFLLNYILVSFTYLSISLISLPLGTSSELHVTLYFFAINLWCNNKTKKSQFHKWDKDLHRHVTREERGMTNRQIKICSPHHQNDRNLNNYPGYQCILIRMSWIYSTDHTECLAINLHL